MDAKVARRTEQEAGSVVLGRLAGRPCPPGFHNAEADTVVNEMDGSTPNHLEPDAVREQLKRILESELFDRAPRRCRFLTYIVEATITGNTKRLNQFAIGFKVFDRDKTFDPSTDAIVRVEAGRLRSRLIEYYNGTGRNDPIVISLPRGYYRVSIEGRAGEAPQDTPATASDSTRRYVPIVTPTP